jgi:hypothetical protein
MLIDFKRIRHSVRTLVSYEAFFKNERRIFLHILDPPILLSLLIYHNVQFFYWLLVLPIKLNMHLYYFSGLSRHYIIQLSCKIFGREAEVLRQNHMPKNVFSIGSLNSILVLPRQVLVHPSWLEVQQLIQIVVQFKQLASHYIDLHYNGISYLISFIQTVIDYDFILDRNQTLWSILINNADTSKLCCCIRNLKMPRTHGAIITTGR